MKTWLWRRLVLPLGLATVALFALHTQFPADGLFINLASSFVVVIVTVLYIDRVLERRREVEWSAASHLISDRLFLLSNSTITNVRTALGIDASHLELALALVDIEAGGYFDVSEKMIEPRARSKVIGLDNKGWHGLDKALQESYADCEQALLVFGNKLKPDEFAGLARLQSRIRKARFAYEVFPDIVGVPDHQLPPSTRGDRREFRDEIVKTAGGDIRNVLI
ncbi:hypothetical protein LCGC14_1532330, partial [marine sediment metagenome]